MTWTIQTDKIDNRALRTTLSENGMPLCVGQVIKLLENDAAFRSFLTATIVKTEFPAFFWETPAAANSTLRQSFEFVLVESRSLENLEPDPSPFSAHFERDGAAVLTFPNLGGDAMLIVPRPASVPANYTHLARFLRNSPAAQVDEFWRCAGTALASRISNFPVWLSTAGMGVSWLHLRIDTRPKYYRHDPYRSFRPPL
jgi:hypothetical protein